MKYPKTGSEVYVSLNLSNTMLTGIGKGTITREEVSASYLKRLFAEHGVIVSAKPEQRRLLEIVNERYDLELEIPETLKLFQLTEEHRRLVVISVTGLRRKNGSLLPEYTEEEFSEATFNFVKYYVQGVHYDALVEENKKLKFELEQELEWHHRTDNNKETKKASTPKRADIIRQITGTAAWTAVPVLVDKLVLSFRGAPQGCLLRGAKRRGNP